MLINRLIDTPYFDTERFLSILESNQDRMKLYEDEFDPTSYSYSRATYSLMELIRNSNKLYIPSDYIDFINRDIEEFESYLLTQLYHRVLNSDADYGKFYFSSKPKKIQMLLSKADTDRQQALKEYMKDNDLIKLVEKYCKDKS